MPHKDPEARKAWQQQHREKNKEKIAAYQKEYRKTHKERDPDRWRKYHREYYHDAKLLERRQSLGIGIRGVDYSDIIGMIGRVPWSIYQKYFEAQGGVCAICGKTPKEGKNLVPDHRHGEKKIRGLLCTNCNHGLGKFFDSPELLQKAIAYLEKENGNA